MNIAFIIPPSPDRRKIIRLIDCSHEAKADYLWQPNEFMIISSLLRPEDSAVLVDGTADGLSANMFLKRMEGLRPDLIFFALSGVCWESDYDMLLRTKGIFPHVPLYVLGDIFQEEDYRAFILRTCDGVVWNPFLLDLQEMAGDGRTTPGHSGGVWKLTETGKPCLKKIYHLQGGYPRHQLFLKEAYRFPFARHFRHATVTTMWGCPFTCSYCPDSGFAPVVRPWQDVLPELEHLKSLRVRELFFADKTFCYPKENIVPLLREMARRFRFSWSCYLHPQLYEEGLLDLMRDAGCHTVIFGIDSADTAMLRKYGRHADRDRIHGLVSHANRIGIDLCADFILGLEQEKEEDILRSIRYALDLPIDFASFNIAAPLPGSSIRTRAKESGRMVFGREGYDTLSHACDLGISDISYEGLRRLRNHAVKRFYLRPSYLVRRLRKIESLEHLLLQTGQMMSLFAKAWR